MNTLIKITFHKPTKMWYALTTTSYKGNKIAKFGNDWNIYADSKEACKLSAQCFIQMGILENALFVD